MIQAISADPETLLLMFRTLPSHMPNMPSPLAYGEPHLYTVYFDTSVDWLSGMIP